MSLNPFSSRKRGVSGLSAVLIGISLAALGFAVGALLAGRKIDAVMVACFASTIAALIPLHIEDRRRRDHANSCRQAN